MTEMLNNITGFVEHMYSGSCEVVLKEPKDDLSNYNNSFLYDCNEKGMFRQAFFGKNCNELAH